MHEWPQCESCTAALYGAAKVRKGPLVHLDAKVFVALSERVNDFETVAIGL
jgi:hypothetical protein